MAFQITLVFFFTLLLSGVSYGQTNEVVTESGLSAVKVLVQSAASVGGAGAYANSERGTCNFALQATIPNCVNSIFGLLQMELSLEGLSNSKNVAIQLLGEGSSHLLVDLKAEGFCVAPVADACTQDAVDKEVAVLYEAMKGGNLETYNATIASLQAQIEGKLAEFKLQGYLIDKVGHKVTPPLGAAQSFSGGTSVPATLFNQAESKFSGVIAKVEASIAAVVENQSSDAGSSLLATAQELYGSVSDVASNDSVVGAGINSKTSASQTKDSSFLVSLSDAQKLTAVVAPQGEEVFGTVSSRYNKMQEEGSFIQP